MNVLEKAQFVVGIEVDYTIDKNFLVPMAEKSKKDLSVAVQEAVEVLGLD